PRRPARLLVLVLAMSAGRRLVGGHGEQDGAGADPDGPGAPGGVGRVVGGGTGRADGRDAFGPLARVDPQLGVDAEAVGAGGGLLADLLAGLLAAATQPPADR